MTALQPTRTARFLPRLAQNQILILVFLLSISTPVAWSDTLVPVSSTGTGDLHSLFGKVLRNNVIDGKVNYAGIAADPDFFDYLEKLEVTPRLSTREMKLAYWINAYNALAIKGILDGKSPDSLFGRYFYFKSTKYKVGGREISLYDLEREILIPMHEPRIHFAIVCASASCPKLLSSAYTPGKLVQQLESDARDFINDPSRNRFDRERKVAYLSKIFDWYAEDFKEQSSTVQHYLARYIDDPGLAKELETDSYEIKYLKYDWSLNGSAP